MQTASGSDERRESRPAVVTGAEKTLKMHDLDGMGCEGSDEKCDPLISHCVCLSSRREQSILGFN